ncbi:MAG: hypothetical protein WAN86_00105, partial [Hyphomicrobiaceae bacterium]
LPLTPSLSPSPSGPLWRGGHRGWPEGGGERGFLAGSLPSIPQAAGQATRFVIEDRRQPVIG